MSIDSFIFKLAILLTPGFLTLHIIKTYSDIPFNERRELSVYDFFLILIFSLLNASILDLITKFFIPKSDFLIFNWITKFDGNIDASFSFWKYLLLCGISLILGIMVTKLNTHSTITWFMQKLGVSDVYGRDDVWNRFISRKTTGQWVTIRDFANGLCYTGLTCLFSESEKERELVLSDVQVFNIKDTAEPMYSADWMYIVLADNSFSIEIESFYKQEDEGVKTKNTRKQRGRSE